jgi:hypothetical protein
MDAVSHDVPFLNAPLQIAIQGRTVEWNNDDLAAMVPLPRSSFFGTSDRVSERVTCPFSDHAGTFYLAPMVWSCGIAQKSVVGSYANPLNVSQDAVDGCDVIRLAVAQPLTTI